MRRIRDAGFVILGKTNTPEFGSIGMTESELNGDCRNPWDIDAHAGRLERRRGRRGRGRALRRSRTAATAAARSASPRRAATSFGIKPSRGRVSPAPYGSGSLGLGTSGPIARTVRDAAALLDVMAGYEPGDFYVAPAPERPFLAEAYVEPGRLRIAVDDDAAGRRAGRSRLRGRRRQRGRRC